MDTQVLLLELIHLYLEKVEEVLEAFKQKWGEEFAVTEWRNMGIPRVGRFPKYGVRRYAFHGEGLFTNLNGVEVDFDLGPQNQTDGFDWWKLYEFTLNFPERFGVFENSTIVSSTLTAVSEKRFIYQLDGSNLYFLKK